MCSRQTNDEWKKCVVERWSEEMILTLAEVMGWNPVEDAWNFSGNHWDCPATVRIISSIHLSNTLQKHFSHNNDCVAMSQVWTRINIIGTLPQMVGPGSGLSLSSPVPMLLLRPFLTCSGVQSPRWLCCFHQLAWFRPENKTQTYFGPYMPCLYACKIQENSMKVTTFTSWFTRLSMKHFASAVIFDCDSERLSHLPCRRGLGLTDAVWNRSQRGEKGGNAERKDIIK